MRCAVVAGPPLLLLLLLLLLVAPGSVLGGRHKHGDRDDHDIHEHEHHEHKYVSSWDGHSLLDLSSLGVLIALKLKLLVLLIVAAGVFAVFSKGYYRSPYGPGYYPYIDYQYVGYQVPAGTYVGPSPYRRPPLPLPLGAAVTHPKGLDLSELTARVWNKIDMAGLAFSAMDVREDDCRRKMVCQADRAAAANPLLRVALSWFSGSLARYRTDRSSDGALDRVDDPCEEMYPSCAHRDLPLALGGPPPEPAESPLGQLGQLGHLGHHPGTPPPLALEPWGRPTAQPAQHENNEYRHEYLYEFPPHPARPGPASDATLSAHHLTGEATSLSGSVATLLPTESVTVAPTPLSTPSPDAPGTGSRIPPDERMSWHGTDRAGR